MSDMNDADIQRAIDNAEQALEQANQQILEADTAIERARLERWEGHLRRERRQSWFDWSNHLFFGFRDMLLFAGTWTLVNFLLVVATPIGVSTVPASDLDFHLSVMLGIFALAWAVSVAYRWFQERRRIIARHRRTLAHLHSDTGSSRND